ncbi:MAG: hypothetical protein QM488_12660 [Rhizobiaceae bacterium]
MTKSRNSIELDHLTDQLVEDVLNMSDAEILSEFNEEGVSNEDISKLFTSHVVAAKMKIGREKLASARRMMMSQRGGSDRIRPRTPAEARRLIDRAAKEHSELTQAARNANSDQVSDRDIMQQYADLVRLGVIIDES